ncbi:unnamed protein product [Prunus armeniaca]
MPPEKKTRSNCMASQDELDYGDSESRQNTSHRKEEQASKGAFTLTDLVATIHAIGETQREIVDTIEELKGSVSKPSEENERPPQEESTAAKKPPYPTGLLQEPYPNGYEAPSFVLFDGRKGNPNEHVNRFVDALGPHAGDYNLRLREISKSLTDCAYTWYTTLASGSVRSWENLASMFCKKYFQHEEKVTTTQLNNTCQKHGEDPVDFVHRFWDLSLDCYDEKDEDDRV